MNKWWRQFNAENVLMSVGAHLALAAIMITSFVIVMNRAMMVVPDRIEIVEIDLNDVVVSGDDTKLFNIGEVTPESPEETTPAPVTEPAPQPEQKPEAEEPEQIEIEQPTLVEEPKPEPVPEPEPQTEAEPEKQPEQEPQPEPKETESKPVEPAPAPKKKKKVVRVNREVLSLERTLTVSVVDALRVAMTRCWVIDTKHPDITDIRAVAHLTMRKNGTVRDVWFESAARADDDPAFAYVLETIRSAINTCQPFRMLPENEFEKWQKIQLTFYPTQGKVM